VLVAGPVDRRSRMYKLLLKQAILVEIGVLADQADAEGGKVLQIFFSGAAEGLRAVQHSFAHAASIRRRIAAEIAEIRQSIQRQGGVGPGCMVGSRVHGGYISVIAEELVKPAQRAVLVRVAGQVGNESRDAALLESVEDFFDLGRRPGNGIETAQEIGQPDHRHAALAHVTYNSDQEPATWIVLLKASVTGDESFDIVSYKKNNPAFPSEPATDQFVNEAQWESYRALGEHIADSVLS